MVCLGLLVYLFETNMLALTGIIYLPLSLGTGNELLGLVLLTVQIPIVLGVGVAKKRERFQSRRSKAKTN